jgi:hypothetical protein
VVLWSSIARKSWRCVASARPNPRAPAFSRWSAAGSRAPVLWCARRDRAPRRDHAHSSNICDGASTKSRTVLVPEKVASSVRREQVVEHVPELVEERHDVVVLHQAGPARPASREVALERRDRRAVASCRRSSSSCADGEHRGVLVLVGPRVEVEVERPRSLPFDHRPRTRSTSACHFGRSHLLERDAVHLARDARRPLHLRDLEVLAQLLRIELELRLRARDPRGSAIRRRSLSVLLSAELRRASSRSSASSSLRGLLGDVRADPRRGTRHVLRRLRHARLDRVVGPRRVPEELRLLVARDEERLEQRTFLSPPRL